MKFNRHNLVNYNIPLLFIVVNGVLLLYGENAIRLFSVKRVILFPNQDQGVYHQGSAWPSAKASCSFQSDIHLLLSMIKHTQLSEVEVVHKLRSGGSGTVFLAQSLETQELYAIKTVPLNAHTKDGFIREASVSTLFSMEDGQHIINTLDCFTDETCGYIIMDVMESDLMERLGHFDCEYEVKRIFQQICSAIQHMHDHQVAHLDIKPDNILLDDKNNAYLCDFGAAMSFESEISAPFGTVYYNAPETRSASFDKAAADIYSLGVLLYILLTGAYPFPGETEEEVLAHLYSGGCACLEDLYDEPCSVESKNLLAQMLQPTPATRPDINKVLSHPWFHLC